VLPVLNYYIWSPEGEASPFYDSVRLFRQEKFGDWNTPIEKLGTELVTTYGRRETNEENTNRKQLCG